MNCTHKNCQVIEIFNHVEQDETLGFDLVFDTEGYCLFHSEIYDWKIKHNASKYFELLLQYYLGHQLSTTFLGFVFADSGKPLVIQNKATKKSLSFRNCFFQGDVLFNEVQINKSVLTIDNCTFHKTLTIRNSELDTINLFNTIIDRFFLIRTKVVYGAAMFNGMVCRNDCQIQYCYFENSVFFTDTRFLSHLNDFYGDHKNVIIHHTTFNGEVDFSDAIFNGYLEFKEVDFCRNVQFINTKFSESRPLAFHYIRLHNQCRIDFRGTPKKKLFNASVIFNLGLDDFDGVLLFEQVNFRNITPIHKQRLLELQKTGKVIIGDGCLKYRHQTSLKSIVLQSNNQPLAEELANTFVQFFRAENRMNLGLEIVNRTDTHLQLFYFTDADISFEEFELGLKKGEEELWKLVKIKGQSVRAGGEVQSWSDKTIHATDTMINIIGTLLKIATRLPRGISKKEVKELLSTTSFQAGNQIRIEQIENLNINQTILLGVGNEQKVNI